MLLVVAVEEIIHLALQVLVDLVVEVTVELKEQELQQ